jgi:phosphomannomutase
LNALKLLNSQGEFISGEDGTEVLNKAASGDFSLPPLKIGSHELNDSYLQKHIDAILAHDLCRLKKLKAKNSASFLMPSIVQAPYVPAALKALGVKEADIIILNRK